MCDQSFGSEGSQLIAQRRAKLAALRTAGPAYPNDFRRDALAAELRDRYGEMSAAELEQNPTRVSIAGRMMTKRVMGKASFAHLQDMSGQIQVYVKRDALGTEPYREFKSWDLGDILGATGTVFRTKKGELSVSVDGLVLLTKALRPLPEKFHGLSDQESRYRQRYVDLIVNEDSRAVFHARSRIVEALRRFFNERGFIEVETPMMHVIPGGATARPFVTHHNALDMDLYLRVAPELYLKRLIVGGMERVFEINRNFRNEGLSTRHNPEFTMLEFYQAYADFNDLMDLTEVLLRELCKDILGTTRIQYQGTAIDFGAPFRRLSVKDAILSRNEGVSAGELDDVVSARRLAERLQIPLSADAGLGKIQLEIYEKTVEADLLEPTFITAYPAEVSPLARRNDRDPSLTDRFELIIAGREIANGFSELNDPEDQAARFRAQAEELAGGDAEAMRYDADYITALEYGLPPTAGEGIGVDRLVMLLTDRPSIRDVLLFPHLRSQG